MNNFDDWSQIISKYLKSEADPLASLTRHELEGDAARTAFIRSVLDRFLPEIYGVGSGQIMDSKGSLSGKMDIIIYRRDFPRLDLPGSRDIYLYESVIATVEVAAKLVKKSFFDALDQCASLAELKPDIDHKVMTGLAARNQLTMNENRQYVHPDPIRTARFHLIGRPLSFIYSFSGYKTSPNQLAETLQAWMDERRENHRPVDMKELPAVIATQGCFAWRNSAPFTVNEHCLMGIGTDQAPVRLIVLQMLHVLSRRLKVTTDGNGLKPGLDGYLNRMPPPKMEFFIGKARNPVVGEEAMMDKLIRSKVSAAKQQARPVSAQTPAPKPAIKKPQVITPVAKKPVSAKPSTAPITAKPAVAKPALAQTPASRPEVASPPEPTKPMSLSTPSSISKPAVDSAAKPDIEIKTRLSSSTRAVDSAAPRKPVERPATNTLAQLSPKPEAVDAPFPVPSADLVPELDPNPPGSDDIQEESTSTIFGILEDPDTVKKPVSNNHAQVAQKPALNAVPNKTAVDVELTPNSMEIKSSSVTALDSADNFVETVKMQMAVPEQDKKSNGSSPSSAGDFLETVKMNIVSPEPIPHLQPESEPEPEPFTSTIPQ